MWNLFSLRIAPSAVRALAMDMDTKDVLEYLQMALRSAWELQRYLAPVSRE